MKNIGGTSLVYHFSEGTARIWCCCYKFQFISHRLITYIAMPLSAWLFLVRLPVCQWHNVVGYSGMQAKSSMHIGSAPLALQAT